MPDLEPDAPDPDAALATLASIAPNVAPDLLIVASSSKNGVEVASAEATDALRAELRGVVRSVVDDWAQAEVIAYGPATEIGSGQVMWVRLSEVTQLDIDSIGDAVADLPMFDPTPAFLRRLQLSAIRAPIQDGFVTFFRSLTQSQVIGRSNKIPVLRSGSRLDVVSDRTLLIDRNVDAVLVGDVVLFDNRKRFERVFGFLEQLSDQAGATFDAVIDGIKISNLGDLRTAATTQWQMLGKMASIKRKIEQYPEYKAALTMSNLLKFVEGHSYTGVKVVGAGDEAEFVFEADGPHRFKILKLLDDDYLLSELTSLAYEANSKGLPLSQ